MEAFNVEHVPLAPEHCVAGFGTTLIVAPHADDESLGCGGLISLLRKHKTEVYILLLSDGALSHPNSLKFPREKLRELRENELIEAAKIMDVAADHIIFCRFPDRDIPISTSANFKSASKNIAKILEIIKPDSVFVPWRRDPHPDHRAAYQLIKSNAAENSKLYEYPIWLNEIGASADLPTEGEVLPFKLDISSVMDKKHKAIAAHRSQTTDLIDDDPEGFRLSSAMLDHFKQPFELFFINK